jgi:succinyl-CoA synthetase beta subunit
VELVEHLGKDVIAGYGLETPKGILAESAQSAREAAEELGGIAVVKSQVPVGGRGKAGHIRFSKSPDEAESAARDLLGSEMAGFSVDKVLVEEALDIRREFYVSVVNDAATKGPLVLFSTEGGVDIEEVHASTPDLIHRWAVDIRQGLTLNDASSLVRESGLSDEEAGVVAQALVSLYEAYRGADADLVEINPLVVTGGGDVVALDCKLSLDPGARFRQAELFGRFENAMPATGTSLERRAADAGFLFIELEGEVGIIANGAGLTMASLDAVEHLGGKAANFLEIGGDAYTKAVPALELVLSNPRVKSLLVNFCGAFARTDVMAEGVVSAIETLEPDLPISFTIHGTGEEEAIALVKERLGLTPHDMMDDAVTEAIEAAAEVSR